MGKSLLKNLEDAAITNLKNLKTEYLAADAETRKEMNTWYYEKMKLKTANAPEEVDKEFMEFLLEYAVKEAIHTDSDRGFIVVYIETALEAFRNKDKRGSCGPS